MPNNTPSELLDVRLYALDLITLVSAEADLLGALQERQLCLDDDEPIVETIHDLHALLKRLDPHHRCECDHAECKEKEEDLIGVTVIVTGNLPSDAVIAEVFTDASLNFQGAYVDDQKNYEEHCAVLIMLRVQDVLDFVMQVRASLESYHLKFDTSWQVPEPEVSNNGAH